MRRWLTTLTLTGATGLLLVACGAPGGADGDLTDDWAVPPAPTPFTPPVGACHDQAVFDETPSVRDFAPVDCAGNHRQETVHVGNYPGDSGQAPDMVSDEGRAAYAECDAKATEYVGAEWRTGRLWLAVARPTREAWAGGARWFRCDLMEVADVGGPREPESRSGSLKGALADPSPLNLGCFKSKVTAGRLDSLTPVDCTREHDTEFAGVWQAPEMAYPAADKDWTRFYDECRKVVAGYVGVPADADLRYRTGVVVRPGARTEWGYGNRGVRCYLWLSSRTLTKSLKDAGPAGLPILTK
ncbi:hypothetical protein GCM10027290_35220 [Micromonospora sonneratiae]|uniref:Septum formation family protein n=1 Tax=Micromonospora sonneratiae TaxID=1184706 RepID=A0ABW3Y9S5_9ACTN